jgi:hypothetical protein
MQRLVHPAVTVLVLRPVHPEAVTADVTTAETASSIGQELAGEPTPQICDRTAAAGVDYALTVAAVGSVAEVIAPAAVVIAAAEVGGVAVDDDLTSDSSTTSCSLAASVTVLAFTGSSTMAAVSPLLV